MTLVGRVQVCCHDERQAAVRRHRTEQLLQRLEPTRGRADADNGKICHAPSWRLNAGDVINADGCASVPLT
jgi:hypothetical protein